MPPTLVRPAHRTLERGRWNPRRGTDARSALARGHAVTSGASPPSPSALCSHPGITAPSQALQRHPRRCGNARRQDIATPAAVLRTASRQLPPRVNTRAKTERKTPTPPPSKPPLDGYRTRHDVLLEARFDRTAVYSTALHTMPSHVDKTVRHACKLPPP
jgi:hypothetical protein